MTYATDYAAYFVLGHLAHSDRRRGLCGSVKSIEEAIAAATQRFGLDDDQQTHMRKLFNVAKDGGK